MRTRDANKVNAGVRLALISPCFPVSPGLVRFGAFLHEQHHAQVIVFVLGDQVPRAIGRMSVISAPDLVGAMQRHDINAVLLDEYCDSGVEEKVREVARTVRFMGGRMGKVFDKLRELSVSPHE